MRFWFILRVLPVCALSGCLHVSHPFSDSGKEAHNLTHNNLPPTRLAVPVPVPKDAPWYSSTSLWAQDVVIALVGQSVPAVSGDPKPGDWWVRLGAVKVGQGIKPRYAIVSPDGRVRARGEGAETDHAGWLAADPDALNTVALQMAPDIAQKLTGIQAESMQEDPGSLMHRAARVYFEGVQGAPGDGNVSLGRAFYVLFTDRRNSIQATPKDADYIVKTDVQLKDLPAKNKKGESQQLVSIVWHVLTPQGQEAGAATQLHAIPAHSLDGMWGDVAEAAAKESSDAVRTIITNYSGRDHKPLPPQNDSSAHEEDVQEKQRFPQQKLP